mgnify:CR=1 FL=1
MKKILFLGIALFMVNSVSSAMLDVYFGTSEKGIYYASFDSEKGSLGDVKLAAEIDAPGFLALHPDKKMLYAVARQNDQGVVAGYQIMSNGMLEQRSLEVIPDGGGAHIAVHPSGKFLLTAQYGSGTVALFPLDDEGKPGTPELSVHKGGSNVVPRRQSEPHPHWCGYSPDGRYAFIPDLGMDGIVVYEVNENKPAISRHGFMASVPGGGPRHMRFSMDGEYIYCLNELSLSVTTFRYNSDKGTAVLVSTTPALSEETKAKEEFNSAAEILVHPSGRFVYSSNRGHDSVTAYETDSEGGEMKVIEVEHIRGAWPRNINMDASGQWLLAAGAHSNTVAVFDIDASTGELTYKRRSVVNVPMPICILFVE